MFRRLAACAAASCLVLASASFAQPPAGPQAEAPAEPAPEEAVAELSEEELAAAIAEFHASLDHKTGKITLPAANVTLNVPAGFYFLDMKDARSVLEEAWGNPPDLTISGMLFRDGVAPLDENAWGVVLTYEDTGYVSDEDASGIDYDMLIDAMREQTDLENAERTRQGYPTLNIIGWATEPRYDAGTHKLYWAKEIAFQDEPVNTLNYDMRVLGRHGVLSLNFVASIDQLAEVEQVSPQVLAIPDFDDGFRYDDFNAAIDKKADFGVVGLIAGGAAAAALAKNAGFLGAAFLFLKKFWFLGFAAVAGLFALVRNLFTSKKTKVAASAEQRSSTAFFGGPAEAPPQSSETGAASSETPKT